MNRPRAAVLTLALFTAGHGVHAASTVTLEHGGVVLHADYVEAAANAQQVFVLVHGTMAHKDMEIIEALQSLLAENGRSSLAITLALGVDRRQGFFDCNARHDHIEDSALDEIGAWLDWAHAQIGAAEVILVGHSRGASQVLRFAARRAPQTVTRLVLIAPPVSDPRGNGALDRARAMVAQNRGTEAIRVPRFLHCQDAEVTARSYLSYYEHGPHRDTIRVLARLEGPSVLVLAGSADQVVPDLPAAVARMDATHRPQLVVIDGADHFFRDLYADELVDAVLDFVDQ